MAAGSTEPRRCQAHGLMVGPDGRCVVCRRERGGGSKSGGFSVGRLWFVATVVLSFAAVATIVWATFRSPGGSGDELALVPEQEPSAADTPAPDEEPAAGAKRERPRANDPRAQQRALERARRRVKITMYMTDW